MTRKEYSQLSDDELLAALKNERQKFTQSHKDIMQMMVDELISRGVYPRETVSGKNSIMTMVECWGANWHEWKAPFNCPHCNLDLRDHEAGPPFKREIGIYSREQDRTIHWKCPSCQKDFPR